MLLEIVKQSERARLDIDFLADVACVSLNRLPPRYIRHDVDMTFFMLPQEMQEIETKVTQAVSSALAYVESREADSASREAADEAKTKIKKPARKITVKSNGKKPPTKH